MHLTPSHTSMAVQLAELARRMTDSDSITYASSSTSTPEDVEIVVGNDGSDHFLVSYALIAGRSPLLEAALIEYGTVVQLDEDARVFHDYLNCLKHGPGKVNKARDPEKGDVFAELIRVWILAESLGDLKTANLVVDEIQQRHVAWGGFPAATSINVVFAECTTYSLLRRLVVDFFVLEANMRDYEVLRVEGVTEGFWVQLAVEMRGSVDEVARGLSRFEDSLGRTVASKPVCDYHLFDEHGCASCWKDSSGIR